MRAPGIITSQHFTARPDHSDMQVEEKREGGPFPPSLPPAGKGQDGEGGGGGGRRERSDSEIARELQAEFDRGRGRREGRRKGGRGERREGGREGGRGTVEKAAPPPKYHAGRSPITP
jgi:hypothetical protein